MPPKNRICYLPYPPTPPPTPPNKLLNPNQAPPTKYNDTYPNGAQWNDDGDDDLAEGTPTPNFRRLVGD